MDKHELNVKVEQMRKQAGLGDYQTAMKIADKIDWRRVSNVSLLTQVSEIYEKNEKYREAKDILLLAVERTPMGRGLLFKLTQLALKVGSIDEAEECFEEFQKLAPQDSRQKLLRYQILKAKGAQPQQLIPPLEEYVNEEISEEWMYELAELYHKAGMRDACLDLCDRITILFGSGEWVQKALRLKAEGEGEPLNEYQQSIAGEIYYQPASAPRQNAVRETAPVTPAFSQSVPVIPEFSLQPQEAVPPVMTAPETVPPFTATPETVPPLTAAPVAAPQYTESVPYGNTAVREAAVPQPAVAMPQYVGGVAAGIAPQPMAAQIVPETPAAPNPAPVPTQALTEQYAAAQEDRYRNVPTFQTATAATTGVPSWTEAVQPQEAPAQNDIDAEIDAHLRRLEEEKLGRRAAATVSQPQSAAPMQVATESMQTAAAAGAGSVPTLDSAAATERAPIADSRTVEQRYREESSRPSREYVVSTEQRAADSEFPGTEQLMVDRLRYEEESAAARARAAARAGEIEEELRSREAKLDETKVLPKLPGQERREQLAREEAELRRLEQDKEAELIQKPAGKTEETAAVDEEKPVKAGERAETAAAVEETSGKATELAAAPAEQVAEKTDEQIAEAAAGKPETAAPVVAEAAAPEAPEEKAAAVTPAAEGAVSTVKEPLAEEAAAAEYRPKQPKLLRTPGSFNALIEGRTPEEGLQGAVERLKEAQAVTGFKRPAAKVKAERLNVYGVRNSAEKTAGRDLIIEEAGDLSDVSLSELIQLIAADGGMRTVLLIDNPLQLTRLRASHPEVEKVFHTADKREDVKAYFAAEAKYREAEARRQEEVTKSALEAKEARRKEEEARRREEEALAAAAAKEAAERERAEAEKKAAEAEREKLAGVRENNVAQAVSAAAASTASVVKEETVQVRTAPQTRTEERERPQVAGATQATETAQAATRQARTHAEELAKLEADKKRLYENEPMTKDAFANYAAVYARNIDCVITGKSMNALYERIELLQADNVKLTRKNAETLIEEAADRAEKPPLSRRLGGLFSKRYNKDGLLILKEEDFLG